MVRRRRSMGQRRASPRLSGADLVGGDAVDLARAEAVDAVSAPPPADASERSLIIACGALAREILALKSALGPSGDRLSLRCLPAALHNRPDLIAPRLEAALRRARAEGWGGLFVGYAECGAGPELDAVCAAAGAERIAGAHCYAFYDGVAAFEARREEEIGAFYLTDFLARHFDSLVWRGLGLDRAPELRDAYFAHYDRLVWLAQTDDADLAARAAEAAARLGLRLERRAVGYGELAGFVARAAEAR